MTFQRGNHRASKLNGEQVLRIRAMYQMRGTTQASLAREFRVSLNTIANIVNGITWQGLTAGESVDRPPPFGQPVEPQQSDIERSIARLHARLGTPTEQELYSESTIPSLYDGQPPVHEPPQSAGLDRLQRELAKHKPSIETRVARGLGSFLTDGDTTDETEK